MRGKRNVLLFGSMLTLGGCASLTPTWSPFPTSDELNSFDNQWAATAKSDPPQVPELRQAVMVYRDKIYGHALLKDQLEWDTSGVTVFGGLAAVAGALAGQPGLMNTGAGLAALGLTTSSRYRFGEQKRIYITALDKLHCIYGRLDRVTDVTLASAHGSSDPAAQDAAVQFFPYVVASVDRVRMDYTNSLLGMAPVTPSREDLLGFATQFKPAIVAATLAVAGGSASQQQISDADGAVVLKLVSEIQACAK